MKTVYNIPEQVTSYDQLLDDKYGALGTLPRTLFEADAIAFSMGASIQAARQAIPLSRVELAQKIAVSPHAIALVENGKGQMAVYLKCSAYLGISNSNFYQ